MAITEMPEPDGELESPTSSETRVILPPVDQDEQDSERNRVQPSASVNPLLPSTSDETIKKERRGDWQNEDDFDIIKQGLQDAEDVKEFVAETRMDLDENESGIPVSVRTWSRLCTLEELLEQFINAVHSTSLLSIESSTSLDLKELIPAEPREKTPLEKLRDDIFTLLRETKLDLEGDLLGGHSRRRLHLKSGEEVSRAKPFAERGLKGLAHKKKHKRGKDGVSVSGSEDSMVASSLSSGAIDEKPGALSRKKREAEKERLAKEKKKKDAEKLKELEAEKIRKDKEANLKLDKMFGTVSPSLGKLSKPPKKCDFCGKLAMYSPKEERYEFCCEEAKREYLKGTLKKIKLSKASSLRITPAISSSIAWPADYELFGDSQQRIGAQEQLRAAEAKLLEAQRLKEREAGKHFFGKSAFETLNWERTMSGAYVLHYRLSDPTFIKMGWTVLPPYCRPVDQDLPKYSSHMVVDNALIQSASKTAETRKYPDGSPFSVFFPNGTGQIFYPDGSVAILITKVEKGTQVTVFHYQPGQDMSLKNSRLSSVAAVFDFQGNGAVYNDNGELRLNYTQNGGVLLDTPNGRAKTWDWLKIDPHVHLPPLQPITLRITPAVGVRIVNQDDVILQFRASMRFFRINVGVQVDRTVVTDPGNAAVQLTSDLRQDKNDVTKMAVLLRRLREEANRVERLERKETVSATSVQVRKVDKIDQGMMPSVSEKTPVASNGRKKTLQKKIVPRAIATS